MSLKLKGKILTKFFIAIHTSSSERKFFGSIFWSFNELAKNETGREYTSQDERPCLQGRSFSFLHLLKFVERAFSTLVYAYA